MFHLPSGVLSRQISTLAEYFGRMVFCFAPPVLSAGGGLTLHRYHGRLTQLGVTAIRQCQSILHCPDCIWPGLLYLLELARYST